MTLPFPRRVLEQHVILFGKTRSGKSSKARVIVEDALDRRVPVCIIDPKGDWWGLKSSADGKHPGFPIVIFGTEWSRHSDVRINEKHGAAIAELIATGNRPALIDLKGMSVGKRNRFFADFAESYFKHTTGERYLMIDEVHNFAPKGKILSIEAGESLHWANRLASEAAGLGTTIIAASQRPQKVHNDFSSSCETLIACRVFQKRDRDAVAEWIDACGDPAVGKELMASIANMQRADAWVYSPEEGFGPKRITWPMFSTYDSFKPQPPSKTRLKGWAEVDLGEVQGKLAAVVEESKASDPKALKAEIAQLKAALEAASSNNVSRETDPEHIEAAERRGYVAGFEAGNAVYRAFQQAVDVIRHRLIQAGADFATAAQQLAERQQEAQKQLTENGPTTRPANSRRPPATPAPLLRGPRQSSPAGSGTGDGTITTPSARKILDQVHAAFPMSLSFAQAATRAGISKRSSQFNRYREQVEASGEIDMARLRSDGRMMSLPAFAKPIDNAGDPVEAFAERLNPSTANMLRAIREHGPLSRGDVATRAGVSPTSSGLGRGLKELIELGLIEKYGTNGYALHKDFL